MHESGNHSETDTQEPLQTGEVRLDLAILMARANRDSGPKCVANAT